MDNTLETIKDNNIKTMYFNCFDTWLEIKDKQPNRSGNLADQLGIDAKTLRDLLLTEDKNLDEIIVDQMPYAFSNPQKKAAIIEANDRIEKELQSIILKHGAKDVLLTLQKKGYKVGMISNIAKAYVPKVLELAPITFDYILLSCKSKYKKTINDNRIYADAHDNSGQKKEEIVMIGDHKINDYDAAIKYGIHAIHMDWKQKNERPYCVHTLEQLLDLFPDKKTQ